jgi:hypothetical protein
VLWAPPPRLRSVPETIDTCTDATCRLALFLAARGVPTDVDRIRRERVEAFIADQLEQFKPTTAPN